MPGHAAQAAPMACIGRLRRYVGLGNGAVILNIVDKLYVCMKKQNTARNEKWLARQLRLKARDIAPALEELEDKGRIYRTDTGEYRAVNDRYVYDGSVVLTASGRAFVWLPDGRELPLEMRRQIAFAGERVRAFVPKSDGASALLVGVPERFPNGQSELELMAAVTDVELPPLYRAGQEKDARYLLSPLGNMRRLFRCELTGVERELARGDVVRVRISRRPMHGDLMRCQLVRIESAQSGLRMFMSALEERYELSRERPEPDEQQRAALDSLHAQGLCEPQRRDLRGQICFTIDGDTAKDFDDAVSLRHDGGRLLLGVHIADVSHFVRTGTPWDAEAYARGTSVYLPWYTFHMLPEALSCELCSLMPDVDRLALTCEMEIEDGMVRDYAIYPSVIHSHARLTYAQVNRLFDGDEGAVPSELASVLRDMRRLSSTLGKRRSARGAINFESSEVEFRLGEDGVPVEILRRRQGAAELLIEEFMLLANQTVAAHMLANGLGCVYRVHEKPDAEDVRKLEELTRNLGIDWRAGREPEPRAFQRLLDMSADSPARSLIQTSALRAMKKAKYSEKPLGHFGLALRDYCHFTSPIRRYPDLLVHRLLHMSCDGRTQSGGYNRLVDELPERAAQCSACELNAATAEREADNLLKCAYMLGREGEVFDGCISGMCSWAIFVELDNMCDGAVPLRTLDEYYTADEAMTRMVSDSGNVLETGMRVRVRVTSVSLAEPRVYLELVEYGTAKAGASLQ